MPEPRATAYFVMNPATTDLPSLLAAEAGRSWEFILESAGEKLSAQLVEALSGSPEALQLPRILACSPFIADVLRRRPELLLDLASSGLLQHSLP